MSISINGSTGISGVDGDATTPALQGVDTNTGISFGTDEVRINTGGTQRAVVDTSGRLGIGTTTVDFSQFGSNTGGVAIADVGATNTGLKISDGSYHNYLVQAGNGNFYISHYGAGDTVFSNGTSGEEAFRVDASRRLLVGTSSNSENVIAAFQGFQGSSTGQGIIAIKRGSTPSSGNTVGQIRFNGPGTDEECAYITAAADGVWGSGDYRGRLAFSTTAAGASSPTERMSIRSNGTQTVFATTTVHYAASATGAGTSEYLYAGSYGATGTNSVGTVSFRVFTNGNVQNTNNSYTAISDIKLKENIVDAKSQWDDLKDIRVVNYNLKEGQTHTQIGLIAQEVELVSPGLVSESPDRDEEGNDLGTVTKSVNYSVLYMKAVKALQEAMERIETLEAEVQALKGGN